MTKLAQPLEVGIAHRYFGLDLVRALAIILVMLAHTLPGGHTWEAVRTLRYFLGYFGVEIFFLLSGFLIGGILLKNLSEDRFRSPTDLVSFWKRRWFRTLPNYYLFLLVEFIVALCVSGALPPEAPHFLWFGQALWWSDPDFFGASWSLAIEEWFYLLFPVCLLALAQVVRNRQKAAILCILVFLIVPPLLRSLLQTDDWDGSVRRITLPRLDAITYGVALAFLRDFRLPAWKFLLKCWPVGLVATVGLAGWWIQSARHDNPAHLFLFRVLFFSFTSISLALWFPWMAERQAAANTFARIVRNLSLWSYSLYLTHTTFGGIIVNIFHHFGWSIYKANAVIISACVWATSLPTSAFLYRYFEKPIMDLREKRSPKTKVAGVRLTNP